MAKRKALAPVPSNWEPRKSKKDQEASRGEEPEEKPEVQYVAKALSPRLPPKGDRRDRLQ